MLALGVILGIVSGWIYYKTGSTELQKLLWLCSICITGLGFVENRARITIDLKDLWSVVFLLLFFAPVFLLASDVFPYQVNTDEMTFYMTSKAMVTEAHPDPFGVIVNYYRFPSGSFYVMGVLHRWFFSTLGFFGMKKIAALLALFGLVFSYAFFRTSLTHRTAVLAAFLLGINQVFIVQGRMAAPILFTVLIGSAALFFIVSGVTLSRKVFVYFGTVILGCGLYTYVSTHTLFVTIPLGLGLYAYTQKLNLKKFIAPLLVPAVLGFFLSTAPGWICRFKDSNNVLPDYYKSQIIFYKEGRDLVRAWNPGKSTIGAIAINAWRGLSAFNNNEHDHSYQFFNPGHGFVDPVTGILLWIGLVIVLRKRKKTAMGLSSRLSLGLPLGQPLGLTLSAISFLSIWLFAALVTTKNPAYPRLTILLCFIPLFAALAVEQISQVFDRFFKRKTLTHAIVAVAGVTMSLNAWALFDYLKHPVIEGHPIGAFVRKITEYEHQPSAHFYIVTNEAYQFIPPWRDFWVYWARGLLQPAQTADLLRPEELAKDPMRWTKFTRPSIVFISSGYLAFQSHRLLGTPNMKITPLDRIQSTFVVELY